VRERTVDGRRNYFLNWCASWIRPVATRRAERTLRTITKLRWTGDFRRVPSGISPSGVSMWLTTAPVRLEPEVVAQRFECTLPS
jgi:hypothetical protein